MCKSTSYIWSEKVIRLNHKFSEVLIYLFWSSNFDRLCGLVVRVPGYRSRGSGPTPGATRFSEKQCVWNGVHLVKLRNKIIFSLCAINRKWKGQSTMFSMRMSRTNTTIPQASNSSQRITICFNNGPRYLWSILKFHINGSWHLEMLSNVLIFNTAAVDPTASLYGSLFAMKMINWAG
jgi:hypothetical protein